jgi:hypothetical protein
MVASNIPAVLCVVFSGVGCTRAAPQGSSNTPVSTRGASGTETVPTAPAVAVPAEASPAASPSDTCATAPSPSHPEDVAASPPAATPLAGTRLYRRWPVSDPLGNDEVSFASGPFPAPAVGEEIWVLGKAGPPRKSRVVRWIANPHDGNLCGAPSTVFVLSVRPKPSSPAVVAFRPVGPWSAPPTARGYYDSPPVASEAGAKNFAFGADVDGDGALDIAEASEPGGCQGSPTARRLAFDPAYDGCDGEYCSELWARDATGKLQVVERVSHGVRSLGY